MRLPLICLLTLVSYLSFAQNFKYKNKKYEWDPAVPALPEVSASFKLEDAVILSETCDYSPTGNKLHSPFVHKHMLIKFNTKKGVDKYSVFRLPESFDPVADLISLPAYKRNKVHRPKGEFTCIDHFAARIIKPDGTIHDANIVDTTETEILYFKAKITYYDWVFKIKNLEPQDVLELDYSYLGVFSDANQSHLFFNSTLPKQDYNLCFKYKEDETYIVKLLNGEGHVDTTYKKYFDHYQHYFFKAKNLKGGMNEVGINPLNEIPHISFYRHLNDFGDYEGNAVMTKPLPYPWWYILRELTNYQMDNLKDYLSKTDETTVEINHFVDTIKTKFPYSNKVELFNNIHEFINAEFDYLNDADYLAEPNGKLEHLGKHVREKKLRYISRTHLYKQLFTRLDTNYFATLIPDNRVCQMHPDFYENLPSTITYYVLPINNTFNFYYPKGNRCGYHVNEFPFYLENNFTALIPQYLPPGLISNRYAEIPIPFVKVPVTLAEDNKRKVALQLEANIDEDKISAAGKVTLSGQFSTLIRGYYLYGEKDSTVNPAYYYSIKELGDDKHPVKVEPKSINTQYPFNASFNIHFEKEHLFEKLTEQNYALNLKGWFKNVIEAIDTNEIRHFIYHADFCSEDVHQVLIHFNSKIKLKNMDNLSTTIQNGFGKFITSAQQLDDNSILLKTIYSVNSTTVPAENFKDVQLIYSASEAWDNKIFEIQKL